LEPIQVKPPVEHDIEPEATQYSDEEDMIDELLEEEDNDDSSLDQAGKPGPMKMKTSMTEFSVEDTAQTPFPPTPRMKPKGLGAGKKTAGLKKTPVKSTFKKVKVDVAATKEKEKQGVVELKK